MSSAASDSVHFFRTWLSDPLRVGAVAPSGEALAYEMTRELNEGPVLELGPGTGVFTPMRVYGAPVGTVAPVLAGTTFFGNAGGSWDLPDIVNHSGSFLVGLSQSGSSTVPMPSVAAMTVRLAAGSWMTESTNAVSTGCPSAETRTASLGASSP